MPEQGATGGITRRRFVRDAGVATIAAADLMAGPAVAARRRHVRPRRRPIVAVFGGGIAGLTAAHELAERGFDVTVYERRAWGGRARSMDVPGTEAGGRRPLPGEHCFRVYFGFYQHVPDTMRRIPFGSNPKGVFDNLVATSQTAFLRASKRDLVIPVEPLGGQAETPAQVRDLLIALLLEMDLPPQAVAHLADRLVAFLSSCDARRRGQWTQTSWRDFAGGDSYGEDYHRIIGNFVQLVASKPDRTSATWFAWVLEHLVYSLLGRGSTGPAVRVLNAPTSEGWIDPWVAFLKRLGVRTRLHHEVTKLRVHKGRITGAQVRTPRGQHVVEADWYVCALPAQRAQRLWSPVIRAGDPGLDAMGRLETAWATGIQFYLRENRPFINGVAICVDSPWEVEFFNEAQFYPRDFARTYGDGRTHDCLSAVITDFDTPGVLYGKPARECTPSQIASEIYEQLKRHVNDPGEPPRLTDEMLLSWHIDPGLKRRNGRYRNEDPIVIPTVGTDQYRPEVSTAIPNLVLAGDYPAGDWEVTTMDTASYNGRRAANAILERAGSPEQPAMAVPAYRPPEWEPFKRIDEDRYRRGLPNLFDVDLSEAQRSELLTRRGSPV
jgi:uncharacterized protein with NAD-binding domain and iron-sulfur cluster